MDVIVGARPIDSRSELMGSPQAPSIAAWANESSFDETSLLNMTPHLDLVLVDDGGFYPRRCIIKL